MRRRHISTSTKRSKENDKSPVRIEWADKNTPRVRRVDQRVIDRYLLSEKINTTQHQAANWYLDLAETAQSTPHLTSQIGKMRVGTGNPVMSNRQAEARVVLKKIDDMVRSKTSSIHLSCMRNVVCFDESMREQQRKYGGGLRSNGMTILREALDCLYLHGHF